MSELPDFERTVRAPYGRSDGFQNDPYQGETYYEKPALKPGHYRWLIASYFWIGGLAGAAAMLSVVADFFGISGDRIVVRFGRYFAFGGALISSVLLIADLQTPTRFYNMLRIFRRTSPMSFGAWALATFGFCGGLAVAAQLAEDLASWEGAIIFGRVVGIPLAITGLIMTFYTGTLLAATSVPFWAAVPRLLPALFAASSASLAAAALTLATKFAGADQAVSERLEMFDFLALLMEAGILLITDITWRRQGVAGPIREFPIAPIYFVGVLLLGIVLPLVLYSFLILGGQTSAAASITAAVWALIGGFVLRAVVLFGGRQSAESPRAYFQFTQPSSAPAG